MKTAGALAPGARAPRSLLFVPGDSLRKIERAGQSQADALILDLEDSVHPDAKRDARAVVSQALSVAGGPRRFVRVNSLGSGLLEEDLDSLKSHPPEVIMLPKCEGPADIGQVCTLLDQAGLSSVSLLPVATETAKALRNLMRADWTHPRLHGLTWGAEDILADIGALANREGGVYTGVFQLARDTCLLAAREAGVLAWDTAFVDVRDVQGCAQEAARSFRAGFDGKLAIHPAQVGPINAAFTPSEQQLEWARRVMDALDRGGQGVALLDGRMIDMPHRRSAEKILRASLDP